MSLHHQTVPQLTKMLANLDNWLDQAEAYAAERGFDVEILVESRLAPDMFPLRRQIQSACDTAKFIGARLSGETAPVDPDDETNLTQLRARIARTKAFLEGLDADAFDGERMLTLGFLPEGVRISGVEYLRGFALPNFYFHITCAYGILRHNGVKLGKRSFIGGLSLVPA